MSATTSSTYSGSDRAGAPFGGDPAASKNSDRLVKFLAFCVFVLSTGFFCAVAIISYLDPNYFDRMLISSIKANVDTMAVGSTEKAPKQLEVTPLPVAQVVRPISLTPKDFAIVMVFQDEAHLASPGELWRVKVGSVVPGLGKILAIEPSKDGGIVKAENATLKAVASR
ncbi:hypothetical protein [Jiella sp. M17.18]|uniref:hypothetical protein n=1 Tax=Jiella sp. M17.18 TaxID=3234247 RepID=UPI0034DEFAB8